MRGIGLGVAAAALVGALHAPIVSAQPIHIPPPASSSLSAGDVVLSITVPANDRCERKSGANRIHNASCSHALVQGGKVRVEGGTLYVTHPGKDDIVVRLRGRKIKDIVNEIAKGRSDVLVHSDFREMEGTLISDFKSMEIPAVSTSGDVKTPTFVESKKPEPTSARPEIPMTRIDLKGDPDRSEIDIRFGVVYTLDSRPKDVETSLLSQGGFQFDVLGSSPRWADVIRLRGRLGFYSNEGFNESTRVSGKDVSTFITNSQQFGVSGEVLFGPIADDYMSFAIEGGANWTVLEAFSFPNVLLQATDSEGEPVSGVRALGDIASDAAVTQAQQALARRVPLGHISANVFLDFPKWGPTDWYLGGGVGAREVVTRSLGITDRTTGSDIETTLRVVTDSTSLPPAIRDLALDPSLEPTVEERFRWGYRLMLGFDFRSFLNLRADVFAPFDRNDFEPLVRLVITKPFKFKEN